MRQSGILLHITSLPSIFGIGDLGPGADDFLSFLSQAGQSVWQVLPTNPTDPICDNSPYASCSVFAANTLFISPELLVYDGLLEEDDFKEMPSFPTTHVDFEKVVPFKRDLLNKAFQRFKPNSAFEQFIKEQEGWLKEYALFVQIKKVQKGKMWSQWPDELKEAHPAALAHFAEAHVTDIQQIYFEQFIFFKQWRALREKAKALNISIMGDIPIYVNYDSVDVWKHSQVFKLNAKAQQEVVAGVPPDYFSATGQRWGNPVYNWQYLKKTRFDWWIKRLKHNLTLCDILRIDHFRAFVNYWEIPAKEKTAIKGYWVNVPTKDFFKEVKKQLKDARIVAEDLGQIDAKVLAKIRSIGFPGMKILMFAFADDLKEHMYLPHNYEKNCVVYTGTHDNNTIRGWFEEDVQPQERANVCAYIGKKVPKAIHLEMIRLALASKAELALFPMQDILGLGQEARMNAPGTSGGNWRWRLKNGQLNSCVADRLAKQTKQFNR